MTKPSDLEAIADQIIKATQMGSVATPRFKPEFLRNKKYLEAIRLLVKQAVYSNWNTQKKPTTLLAIYRFVEGKIKDLIATNQWNSEWTVPGKRTVDRRVNECADARFWVDEVTPVIAVKAGLYCPNPYLFEGEIREKLKELTEEYMKELK